MRRRDTFGFLAQIGALAAAAILVHSIYVTVVRPRADTILAEQTAAMQEDPDYVQPRSLWVTIRDFEQEACFILMLWAMAIMALKGWSAGREARLLDRELVPVPPGMRILPEDAREYARGIESLPEERRSALLPRALLAALHRFLATRNIQDVSDTATAVCDAEAERLESELSMVRYIAWAIPSIGFIGTVRGIGEALGKAHKAVEGEIAGVTQSLGTAFNSTFIALLISIVLMFLLHQLQLRQERLVLDCQSYLDTRLVRHLGTG
ncbi:MAG: MotA/TolQ/ExbB proton channel family protein [Thermoanaerobaculia bacterium]|nr:MotA/TolQ/ExbB proton channel family protein [Thermoanaerobaculia bacterium]